MTQHIPEPTKRNRAKWGTKRGWITHGAKFSPEQSVALERMVQDLGSTVDSVIHDAVILYLSRHEYLAA